MDSLGVVELFEKNSQSSRVKEFEDKTNSTLRVETKRKKTVRDTEWMEIVNIEQAKKVTVETIKHLSKNTNFIQTVDDKTGDVTPSKLLNVRKEESYDTYENRLIYTLIQNSKLFIKKKKEELAQKNDGENERKEGEKDSTILEYNATSEVKDEKINVQLKLNSELDPNGDEAKEKNEEILKRIETIESKINVISNSEPYKVIDKLHISLIREPIRKTNVVLKNVNFQYAMKLWSYLRENFDGDFDGEEENRDYMDTGELKQFINETFLLQYLAMKTIDEDRTENEVTYQELKEKMIEKMIEKVVDIEQETENISGVDTTEQQLIQMISNKYEVVKYKRTEIIKEIQQIFKKYIEKYEEQIEKG